MKIGKRLTFAIGAMLSITLYLTVPFVPENGITLLWIMSWVYPVFSSLLTVLAILLYMTWCWRERSMIILLLSIFVFTIAISTGMLAVATGERPLISIDTMRPCIVASRIVSMISCASCIIWQYARLGE